MIGAIERKFIDYAHRPFIKIVRDLKPRRILEIGVGQGIGAEYMIKASGRDDIEYFGFDLFDRDDGVIYHPATMDKIREKLKKLGVKKVHLFKGNSQKTLPQIVPTLPKMDFIYIDGDHSYYGCKQDLCNIEPLRHSGTVVIIDDANKESEGVRRVVNEIKDHSVSFIVSRRFWLLHLPTKHIKAIIRQR